MASFSKLLVSEVVRIVRKEVRQHLRKELVALRKALAAQRSAIAALKLRLREVEKTGRPLRRQGALTVAGPSRSQSGSAESSHAPIALRFRPQGLASHRKRLGLTGAQLGAILGVTAKAVYDWEQRRYKPSLSSLQRIAHLRKITPKQAQDLLAAAQGQAASRSRAQRTPAPPGKRAARSSAR